MKKRLSRSKLAKLVAAYDAGEFTPSSESAPAPIAALVRVSATVDQGSPVRVTGIAGSPTYARAKSLWDSRRIVLTGSPSTGASETHGSALEPMRANKIGRVLLTNAFFHQITCPDSNEYPYVNSSFAAIPSTADVSTRAYAIAAQSSENASHARIAVLVPFVIASETSSLTASVSNNVLTLEIA